METNHSAGHKRKFVAHKKSMPTLRCVCGSEILVVPDLKAMSNAIKNHIAEHKHAGDGSERTLSLEGLEQVLTEQILIMASKIDLENESDQATDDAPYTGIQHFRKGRKVG